MPDTQKETKAQRAERLKREKNPWECLGEIRRFAEQGFAAIPPEWLSTYLRWWGVYTQGDGAGVVGGKGGEGKALPYFMVRIRIPNGLLLSHQLRAIADRIEERLRTHGIRKLRIEGYQEATWILLDYGDVVAHIMAEEQRAFYNLEGFWSNAPRLELELTT